MREVNVIPKEKNIEEFLKERNNKVKNRTIIELLEGLINYKLVKIDFEFPNITITYIFRNSSGKIIPDKMFAEYKFKNHNQD